VKRTFSLSQVYRLLEPGPVVMVTTAYKERVNIMTMSWHTMIDFEPPIVGCVISNQNYTFGVLKATKECVINIPTVELAAEVVGCGNTSGRTEDKFKTFGLTPTPASRVGPPLIAECYANLECVLSMQEWHPNTISSSLRCSRHGLILQGKTHGPSIISAEALSWSQAKRSSCLPG
jgi:hypothetical protein